MSHDTFYSLLVMKYRFISTSSINIIIYSDNMLTLLSPHCTLSVYVYKTIYELLISGSCSIHKTATTSYTTLWLYNSNCLCFASSSTVIVNHVIDTVTIMCWHWQCSSC